ncbi:hypothetical protein [Streptomyces sp. NPDC093594]|uniref:hypothetical protein n=1 Tax=Streptomyces sp. NPDC093594 TaxID=3155305 RepID=UPI0034504E56
MLSLIGPPDLEFGLGSLDWPAFCDRRQKQNIDEFSDREADVDEYPDRARP